MNTESTPSASPRPTGTPFWVAAGFIAAFGATIATVILTGLYVRAPGSRAATEQAPAAASQPVGETAQPSAEPSQGPRETAQPSAEPSQGPRETARPSAETVTGEPSAEPSQRPRETVQSAEQPQGPG